jgi:glycosyltransferase involved in cell wall biosynthesis
VHFTGRVEAEDIARAYAESTVAVVPSLYEGFGFPAGEAMACEVPLVSTTAGALPDVVGRDGRAGLLVEPGSATALADAIGRLLDQPELRREMGIAGRAGRGPVHLAQGCRAHGRVLPRDHARAGAAMLTMDFDKLGLAGQPRARRRLRRRPASARRDP